MSDLAHVPGQRIQLKKGGSLQEVFASAKRSGGDLAEPPASDPLRPESVRSPSELEAVISEAGLSYEECGKLTVSLAWWNRNSNDSDWQVASREGPSPGA